MVWLKCWQTIHSIKARGRGFFFGYYPACTWLAALINDLMEGGLTLGKELSQQSRLEECHSDFLCPN